MHHTRRPGRCGPRYLRNMRVFSVVLVTFAVLLPLTAQDVKPKDVRDAAKSGASAIPTLQGYLKNRPPEVRAEAVKQLTEVGTAASLDPLILGTQDADPQIQILATDGLVNFYSPGYVKTGIAGSIRKVGTSIKGKFTDTNDLVIDGYVTVRADVIEAIAKLVKGGVNADVRANAAHAEGILRGRAAVPELIDAVHTKDTDVIYEALVAIEKIRDPSAGPDIAFLLHDLKEKVQVTAIEATGLLTNRAALNELRDVLDRSRNMRVKRAALTAMAQMPDPQLHGVFVTYLDHKDEGLREGAAEGLGRLKNPEDTATLERAFNNENKTEPRLSVAFALVNLGKRSMGEFDPLRYLVNDLNSAAYRGVSRAYLTELARDPEVRQALYPALQEPGVTKDEKTGLAEVFAASGGQDSVAPLEALSQDPDTDVSQEGLRAVKNLRARLP